MSSNPSELSDQELLNQLTRLGSALLTVGQLRLASFGDVTDDPRWGAPLPLRFEAQVPVLFLGVLDAFDAAIGLLRTRASQQAFHLLRFQIESIALIRWLSAPPEAAARQHRAYRVACGQIRRFGRFLMGDAGRDPEALKGVRAVRDWGDRLREIADEDGIQNLKQEPDAAEMFKSMDAAGYTHFSMYSELGSHPGTAGNLWFAINSDSKRISYDLGGSLVARGFLVGTCIFYLWKSFETVADAMGWNQWLQSDARPAYYATLPLMQESLNRRNSTPE